MLTTRSGLFALDNNGFTALARVDTGRITETFNTNDKITSVIIRDENVAYFSVKGDGIYATSNRWKNFKLIQSAGDPNLLSVFGSMLFANFSSVLQYSDDGATFHQAGGFLPTDTVSAAEAFSLQTAVAVTGKKLYRSLDGGKNWFMVLDGLVRTNSIYVDRTHKIIYIGGSKLMKSLDSGKSWQTLTNVFYNLAGPVVGSRDCSGTFYIASDPLTHGVIYRSVDQGKFFQEAGPGMPSLTHLKKAVVLDRGSTFFWLDTVGLLYYVRDGIDGVITDSVRDRIIIEPDTGVRYSLCNNLAATSFGVSLLFDQCTGIILDSLKQIKPAPQFAAKFIPGLINDTTIRIAFTYKPALAGRDTAHYRLKFHSPLTGNIEQVFFDVTGSANGGSPELLLSSSDLAYAPTYVDSARKLSVTISNIGCDTLRIDTIFSTNPAIFVGESKNFPLKIVPGKNIQYVVTFSPHFEGDYLESLDIETNSGARFISMSGKGIVRATKSVPVFAEEEGIRIYPNPANNFFTINSVRPLPERIVIRDLLGREVLTLKSNGAFNFVCDLHSLCNGYYVIDLEGSFQKIIIAH